MLQLKNKLPQQTKGRYLKLLDYVDDTNRLLYEMGACSIKELMKYKKRNSFNMIQNCLELYDLNIYHGDWKLDN